MNSTDNFKKVISEKLQEVAANDKLFKASLQKKKKNIDDCVTYIINQVRLSKRQGFTDDEIFGMAIHYYDEDNIKPGKPINCKVVVNHAVELSEEEKEKARKEAREQVISEEKERLQTKRAKKIKKEIVATQQSLF